jgi:SAM-dependent methyltransferase
MFADPVLHGKPDLIGDEIRFFDAKAEQLLGLPDEDLVVSRPYRHLAGSRIAFDYMIDLIGDCRGKTIADVGCGCGWFSVYLAQQGARLEHGFDVSPKMIEAANRRAHVNEVADKVRFTAGTADMIGQYDDSFDLVVGISVLHHINIEGFSSTLNKAWTTQGRSVFLEPLGGNRLIDFFRQKVHLGLLGERTEGEEPLGPSAFVELSRRFAVNHREFQFLGAIARYVGDRTTMWLGLDAIDGCMLAWLPAIRRKCRLTVVELAPKER